MSNAANEGRKYLQVVTSHVQAKGLPPLMFLGVEVNRKRRRDKYFVSGRVCDAGLSWVALTLTDWATTLDSPSAVLWRRGSESGLYLGVLGTLPGETPITLKVYGYALFGAWRLPDIEPNHFEDIPIARLLEYANTGNDGKGARG